MQAVILAGGFGTRLAHVVSDVPKPMAPIKNIPFLEYIVNFLQENGFDNFVFLTGYKAEMIENHFKNLPNKIFVREEKALGTGGAILNAFKYLQNDFFVINGDTFFDIDYSLLKNFGKDKLFTVALRYTNNVERYGLVDINDNYQINSFFEKRNLQKNQIDGYINGGIYYIKKSVLQSFANKFNGNFISLENDIFPVLLKENKLYGLPLGGFFIDIGIPEDYYRAQTLIPEWIKKAIKPALFIDKDGTLIENTGYPHGKSIIIKNDTAEIIKKYIQKDYVLIMCTNQAGIAKSKFTLSEMTENIEAIKNYYKTLGINFKDIEYCPYHPEGTIMQYKYLSVTRKPHPGMLLKACEKIKIDMKNSIMIGDNPSIDKIKLPYLKSIILGEKHV